MLKFFRIDGYAVNKRGNTVGIHYIVTSNNSAEAVTRAKQRANQDGYRYIRVNYVKESHHA